MIEVVVTCPGAPFLLPGVAPSLLPRAGEVPAAAASAVSALHGLDRVVVLAAAWPRPDGTDGSVARRAVHDGAPGSVSARVGRSLLAGAGVTDPVVVEVAPGPVPILRSAVGGGRGHPGSPRAVGAAAAAIREAAADARTGLLVVAEGSACAGPSAPGGDHPGAAAWDAALTAAVRDADPAALAGCLRPDRWPVHDLLVPSASVWAVLAAVTAEHPPAAGRLLAAGAPFGVSYLVATWTWPDRRSVGSDRAAGNGGPA
ncbi:hypothetical protein [Nakamurella leprariae]|uniref:Uncharacterized protein n=1 Tax=Nakamurella leprariae TaxID=2803911 RepID=A0A938YEG3_9ACTN|nr:hypothetical protein [Nakamurella leprariae]MBM9469217.1 hypothetical protein [Nakamurella leprariae]